MSRWSTLEEQQENDKLKYDRAVNRGFNYGETYFVINCKEDKIENIYDQVKSLPFVDLTEEQFQDCILRSANEDIRLILDYLEQNPSATKNELCKALNMSKEKVSSLLRKSAKQGIVEYDTKSYERLNTPGRKVYVYRNEDMVYSFESIALARRELEKLIDFPYKDNYLRNLCLSQGKYEEYSFSF